ncbi:hypothetical protein CFC21_008995 [Triticum aestivum]|uniref:Protein WAVE n=2 Tax=Triticum aestivum TaxID=4565 RepID=A0A9R1DI59_WHEAT|nr:uncharacterized protein LOC123145899 [Triticum aestivum]KAF6991947.1 hypothetical protein CFC21_008995 [Triticum aestivum]
MDPKAAARSKRSHTVHGRRTHQTPAAAAAHKQKRAAAAGGGGGGGGGSSSAAPRSRNLPSNWDRYEDEPEADDAAEWAGEVAPRSKGADFAFLLEQARAQPLEERGLGAAGRLASQDSAFDFMQASTSMLEAKGEGIMSWFDDDNFILEDDLAPDFEVPFLSMDLHALATKLSKIKLSQRLFMEEDLLPEDLAVASEDEDDEILIQLGTTLESDAKGSLVQHNFRDINPGKDAVSPDHASNIHSDGPLKTHHQSECFAEEATTTSFKAIPRPMHSDAEAYTGITGTVPNAGHREQSKLGMVAPEEGLDMLLNSLDGTHLSSSNLDESFGSSSTLVGMKINESNEKVMSSSTTSKLPALSPVDDDLDALLSETSLSVQNDGSAASSLSSRPTFDSKSNVDFRYAKQIDVTSIDDSVDDLLADTPFCLSDQKETTPVQEQQHISNANAPPPSGSSNVSADFDSWFDSL